MIINIIIKITQTTISYLSRVLLRKCWISKWCLRYFKIKIIVWVTLLCNQPFSEVWSLKEWKAAKASSYIEKVDTTILQNPDLYNYKLYFEFSVCEKNYNLQPGQIPLVCIDIDSKVNYLEILNEKSYVYVFKNIYVYK